MRHIRRVAVALVLMAASCARDGTGQESAEPASSAMAGLTASCGGAVFDRLPPDKSYFSFYTLF
jgi:hypothetical protein